MLCLTRAVLRHFTHTFLQDVLWFLVFCPVQFWVKCVFCVCHYPLGRLLLQKKNHEGAIICATNILR